MGAWSLAGVKLQGSHSHFWSWEKTMLLDKISRAYNLNQCDPDFFTYDAFWNPLGANANVTVNVPVQADSDFVLRALALESYSAVGVLVVAPDYLITIFDSGSGRALMNQPVHVGNITGSAQLPFILPEAKLIAAASIIQVTLLNNTAVAAVVHVDLIGFKLFYKPGFSRDALGSL
jgi:hypothetical protein